MSRRPGFLLPFLAVAVLTLACKKPAPKVETSEKQSPAASSDGWTTFEDGDFRLSVPPADKVLRSSLSNIDGFPTFSTDHMDSMGSSGRASFRPYAPRSELIIRDAAELELKDFIAGGARVLVGVHAVPMKTGACAAFTAVAGGKDCATNSFCGHHMFVAYCDTPLKKRYIFSGNLGDSNQDGQRPPDFAKNSAILDRILRSIEFKKS